MRFVIDTSVLVSALLQAGSVPDKATRRAATQGWLIFTESTHLELTQVLYRSKFDRYTTETLRGNFLHYLMGNAEFVSVTRPIRACRDPNDDKFLEAAAHGNASHLITGDADLLMLHPFMKVEILTPADFLSKIRV